MNPAEPDAVRRLGVIAGGGDLPRRVAEARRARGEPVSLVALEGFADDWVEDFPHLRAGVGELGRIIAHFKSDAVDTVTFAGVVKRPNFAALKVDARGARVLPRALAAAAKGDDALLRVVLDVFEKEGFVIAGPESFAKDLLAEQGVLAGIAPEAEHEADIVKALDAARALGALDIGQGAVVRDGLVLALEAQEGTDRMLARVSELVAEGSAAPERKGVLAKVAKPIQDRRVDLPTVGVTTVHGAARARLAGIVVEAGGALIVDREAVAEAADAAGLFVLVRPPADGEGRRFRAGSDE